MNLYVAGIYASNFNLTGNVFKGTTPAAQLLRREIRHHLESYHYIKKGSYTKWLRRDGVKVFLDSGAFSAFSLGVEVDIGEYAEFLKEYDDLILMASVLDAIGDHEATFKNQQELEHRGCEVLPCFHFGEPYELAEYYVRNYKYITIGGMVPVPNVKLEPWLDDLWERVLTDKDGISRTKIHGFGLTSRTLMKKYPWYSVDSSSWVQAALNGSIVLPEIDRAMPVSERSPQRKQFGAHYNTFPEPSKEYVQRLLEYYGLTLEEVQHDYRSRWALNAFTFDRLGRILGDDHHLKPFKTTQPVLFD